jgi:hypothetical protein
VSCKEIKGHNLSGPGKLSESNRPCWTNWIIRQTRTLWAWWVRKQKRLIGQISYKETKGHSGRHVAPARCYPVSKLISLCSYSLILHAWWRSNIYTPFVYTWLTIKQTHDLLHMRQAWYPIQTKSFI